MPRRALALALALSFLQASCVYSHCRSDQQKPAAAAPAAAPKAALEYDAAVGKGHAKLHAAKTAYEISRIASIESDAAISAREGAPKQVLTALTAGFVFAGLKSLLGDVDRMLSRATGEAQIVLGQLHTDLGSLSTEFERMLGDDLSHTLDKLDATQRDFVQGVDRVILQTQRSLSALTAQVSESSLQLVYEADIAAYDALYALPLRGEQPRIVYWTPRTYFDTRQPQLVEIHGNFLDVRPPVAKLDGQAITPAGVTRNVVQIVLPPPTPAPTDKDVYRKVDLACTDCELRRCWFEPCESRFASIPGSLSVAVHPQLEYGVTATIQPRGRQTEHDTFTFTNYLSDDDCNADYHRVFSYCMTDGWVIDGAVAAQPTLTTANCGSSASSAIATAACVDVTAHLKGCGTSWIFNCNGRGWIGYQQPVAAKRLVEKEFAPQQFQTEANTNTTFTFEYGQLPPESRVDEWKFWVTIRTNTGKEIQLSHANPSVPEAHAVLAGGTLSVSIDQNVAMSADHPQR